MKTSFFLLSTLCLGSAAAAADWYCEFAAGKWNRADWLSVKSPRWSHFGGWIQEDGRIANQVPADATPAEMLDKRAAETYSSMIWNHKICGAATISSRMEFTDRMAPLIVLAAPPAITAEGVPEYREHWEIVLFDEGINVWHHKYSDGKPYWSLTAYLKRRFEPKTVYDLQVQIIPAGEVRKLIIKCDGSEFGFESASLPEMFFAGITGCEGINHFYDFRVNTADD